MYNNQKHCYVVCVPLQVLFFRASWEIYVNKNFKMPSFKTEKWVTIRDVMSCKNIVVCALK